MSGSRTPEGQDSPVENSSSPPVTDVLVAPPSRTSRTALSTTSEYESFAC